MCIDDHTLCVSSDREYHSIHTHHSLLLHIMMKHTHTSISDISLEFRENTRWSNRSILLFLLYTPNGKVRLYFILADLLSCIYSNCLYPFIIFSEGILRDTNFNNWEGRWVYLCLVYIHQWDYHSESPEVFVSFSGYVVIVIEGSDVCYRRKEWMEYRKCTYSKFCDCREKRDSSMMWNTDLMLDWRKEWRKNDSLRTG